MPGGGAGFGFDLLEPALAGELLDAHAGLVALEVVGIEPIVGGRDAVGEADEAGDEFGRRVALARGALGSGSEFLEELLIAGRQGGDAFARIVSSGFWPFGHGPFPSLRLCRFGA